MRDEGYLSRATAERQASWQNLDRSIGSYARLVPFRTPHVQVRRMTAEPERFESIVAARLAREIAREGKEHPLLKAKVLGGSPEAIKEMLTAANASLQFVIYDSGGRTLQRLSDVFWLDEV